MSKLFNVKKDKFTLEYMDGVNITSFYLNTPDYIVRIGYRTKDAYRDIQDLKDAFDRINQLLNQPVTKP